MNAVACENLKGHLQDFSLVLDCDRVKSGALRIATPFTYPDGSHVDVFFEETGRLHFDHFLLSDYGQTFDYLFDLGFNVWSTKRRKGLVAGICRSLGVEFENNSLMVRIPLGEQNNISDYIIRLAQACIRVTDLSFTHRVFTVDSFETVVEEVIAATDLPYSEDVVLPGRFQTPVKINFEVTGRTSQPTLVQTLASKDPYAFHNLALEVFSRWDAIREYRHQYQFITVFNEESPRVREDDFGRLYEVSTPLAFPSERAGFVSALGA